MRFLKVTSVAIAGLALVTPVGLAQGIQVKPPNASQIELYYPATGDAATSRTGTLSQNPVASQHVTYEDGWLAISADNSTLMDILHAVQAKTGTALDATGIIDNARVTVNIGPDNPRKVLGALLYGTPFNYIIVGSTDNRHLTKIILLPKNNLLAGSLTASAAPIVQPTSDKRETPISATADAGMTSDESLIADAGKNGEDEKADQDDKNKDDGAEKEKKVAEDKKPDGETEKDAVASAKAGANSEDGIDLPDDGNEAATPADRMAKAPAAINPAIAALYPGLFPSSSDSSQSTSPFSLGIKTGSPAIPIGNSQAQTQRAAPVINIPTDSNGTPILPSNIPPEMWGLYPANLMQLIHSNTPQQVVATTPLSPTLPVTGGGGQTLFWDQTIKPAHP
jgi:hypothetical protein